MGQQRWYLTSILLGFLVLCLTVLAVRWNVLASRVPLAALPHADAPLPTDPGQSEESIPPATVRADSNLPSIAPLVTVPATESSAKSRPTAAAVLNLNTATAAELETLPGIGPKLASAIIEYRNLAGSFKTVDDLTNVPGIGDAKLADLRPLVRVE